MGFGRTVNVVTEYLPGSMLLGVAAPLVRLSIPISMREFGRAIPRLGERGAVPLQRVKVRP